MSRNDGIFAAVVGTEYVLELTATDENGDNITYALSEDLSYFAINQSKNFLLFWAFISTIYIPTGQTDLSFH